MAIEEYHRRQSSKSHPLFFILVCGSLAFLLFSVYKHFEEPPISNSPDERTIIPFELVPSRPSTGLAQVVLNALEGSGGTYGIVVKNLKTGESYFANEHRVFEPASVYKLWIMGVVFQQIQDGRLNEDNVLAADIASLNKEFEIPEEGAEETEGSISLTVRDAIFQMITISDNYAALILTEEIGLNALGSYLLGNGFSESKVGVDGQSPTTTPRDIALFLEKLYGGKLANEKYTQEMMDILKWQKLNDGLPKYLPDKIAVAHKTGEMETNTHDAGIVFTDFGDYIIVVFSEGGSRAQAQERVAEVSRAVYQYFSSPPEVTTL